MSVYTPYPGNTPPTPLEEMLLEEELAALRAIQSAEAGKLPMAHIWLILWPAIERHCDGLTGADAVHSAASLLSLLASEVTPRPAIRRATTAPIIDPDLPY